MTQKILLNLKGEKEIVDESVVLSKLKSGYRLPVVVAILLNHKKKDKKHIKTEYNDSHRRIIQLMESGYELLSSGRGPRGDLNEENVSGALSSDQSTKALSDKILQLEKALKAKEEEFEIFKGLSQINVDKSKRLYEENLSLKAKIDTMIKPVVNNFLAQHLLEIIGSNPLEEVILSKKDNVYSFSGTIKVKK